MTSVPGSKNLTVALIICCMSVGMLLGAILSQRRSAVRFYEKQLERTVSVVAERNLQEKESQTLRD